MTDTSEKSRTRGWFGELLASASIAAIAAMGATTPASALVVRDDVGVDGAVDVDNQWAGVGMMFNRTSAGNYVCTGQLVNPRTVILAAHCTIDFPDDAVGPNGANHMGFSFNPTDALSGYNAWRDAGLAGTWASNEDTLFYNVLQTQTVFDLSEFFPGGDILMATIDTPVVGLPTYGMLFSPISGETHATQVGYGTTGTGSLGDIGGIDYKRRVGENIIDGLFSQNDFIAAEFGVPGFGFGTPEAAQLLYHVDFDRPDRTPGDCERGEFFGTGNGNDIVCFTGPYGPSFTLDGSSGVLIGDHMNWYGGDALERESGTAGGDSGSALFADEIYSQPLVTGVLSGGWVAGIAAPQGGYGDVAYYNPLFLFRDWIVENNPYVYASTRNGSGNWSDPNYWVQNMDPNYFYIDATGRVRNGLPNAAEPGYFADDPKWGTVFDTDVSNDFGDTGPDVYLGDLPAAGGGAAGLSTNGLARAEAGPLEAGEGGSSTRGHTASNSGPTGPGSRGFVPNNSHGTYGTWDGAEDGTARFYDVTLNNNGYTTLDINVEIDNLTIAGAKSSLDVSPNRRINALVAVDQFTGLVNADGTIRTREYMLWGGRLTGDGTIRADTVYNIDGIITAGEPNGTGVLDIVGDYVQTNLGDYIANVRRQGNTLTTDLLQITGDASLDGNILVTPVNANSRAKYQDSYRILDADHVVGNFANVVLVDAGPTLYGESVVRSGGRVDIVVRAVELASVYGEGHSLHSLGAAIDTLRFGGQYDQMENLFSIVDGTTFANFDAMMYSLTPTNSFQVVPMAVQYTQNFTLGLSARTAELRAGQHGISQRSLLNGLRIAQAGTSDTQGAGLSTDGTRPLELGDRFGLFVSGQGNLSAVGDEAYEGDRYNPSHMTAFSSADMTVGADYRVSDNMAIGVATTFSRFLNRDGDGGVTPMDHTGYGAMAYATTWEGNWFADAYVGVARHEYQMMRAPGYNFADGVDSAPGAVQRLAGVRGGWMFEPMQDLHIGPTVSLDYSSLNMDAYQESGLGDLALGVDARNLTSVTLESALEFNYAPAGGRSPFAAYGRLGVVSELGDGVDLVRAHFLLAPDAAFDVSRALDRNWVSSAFGFSYQLSEGMAANLEASSDMGREDLENTSVRAGFSWNF